MNTHASDHQLDGLRLGIDDPAVRAHLATCPHCQARQATLEADASAFLSTFQLPQLARDAVARVEARRGPLARLLAWRPRLVLPAAMTLAASAAALLFALTPEDHVRAKGGAAQLEAFVLTAEGRAPLAGPVAPDARLAVKVTRAGPRFVRLLWESAPGRWDALYPGEDGAPWRIDGAAWLEREVVLDGAPAPERLGGVFCEAPVDHAAAVRFLRGEARAGCTLEAIVVVKAP